MSRIDEIKARWAKATPGKWYMRGRQHISRSAAGGMGSNLSTGHVASTTCIEDTEAIASAPEDIAWLAERLERADALLRKHSCGGRGTVHDYDWPQCAGVEAFLAEGGK